jgi:glycosyltransferase involved in cell wall biosynthesis
MNRPRISVAMCTYNGSRFVWEQLQSIATQSCLPHELVICDDGSTDDTMALISTFAAQAPFHVRVFSNESTLGVTKNFERAIRLCEGNVISLSDQDDIWGPEKLERLWTALENDPEAGYAFSDAEVVDEQGKSLVPSLWGDLGLLNGPIERFHTSIQLEVLLRGNVVMGASMAFRERLREIILPISKLWIHDYWIAVLGSTFTSGVCISECLLKYRRHPAQQMGVRYLGKSRRKISLATTREEYWKKAEAFRELQEQAQSVAASLPCSPANLELLAEKEKHLSKRAAIHSTKGISRVEIALSEAFTGRYQRFSDSWRSFGRDLIPSWIVTTKSQQEENLAAR